MPRRSLFWTFAGVFLLVLAVATALEIVVVVTVLRPLASQRTRERAELALDRTSRQIAALYDPYDLSELERVLGESQLPDPDAFLVLSAWDGRLVTDRALEPRLRARIGESLSRAGLTDSVPTRAGASASSGAAPAAADVGLHLLGHRTVIIEGSRFGEVVAFGPPLRASLWLLPETRALALFLPFAVLASGVAGVVMVRILARRLRALEQVATRVTEGELSARVEVGGADEVGRLEEAVNRMTERLAGARAQLERTDLERRRLFGDITHELATPLTSIRGYVETLLDPRVPVSREEHATYLNDVLEESKRLDRLIADLLELTRLEAGATPLEIVRLDWAALCVNAAHRLAPRFAEAGLRLDSSGIQREAWVRVDGRRIEQLVDNLLVNALRYVPAGGTVWLSLERFGGEEPLAQGWRLTVADDGPGIPPGDLSHVFERFYRAETVRAHAGTGLGLAIVRETAHRHGGTARAEARAPRGAAFIVELPAAS